MITHRTGRCRQAGLTIVETTFGAAILVIVVGGAVRLLDTSRSLALSTSNQHMADIRVERGLSRIERDFRGGSLATAQHVDASSFDDGETGNGFGIRPVTGWQGSAVLGDVVAYRWELPVGESEGDLIRSVGSIDTTLATGVTAFSVTRSGSEFTFTLAARCGPVDDRGRTSSGTISVMARNL